MPKISLLAGIAATTIGLAVVSTGSAFAMGCLTNQENLVPISLTHSEMTDSSVNGAKGQGPGYDKDAYLAALAKGNACPATEQAQPVSATSAKQARYN